MLNPVSSTGLIKINVIFKRLKVRVTQTGQLIYLTSALLSTRPCGNIRRRGHIVTASPLLHPTP